MTVYFNPRSHEGSDPNGFGSVYKLSDFNPRSHEGSDLKSHRKPVIQLYFNPRSHEGSDYPAPFTIATTPDISIHAPTRGATMFCLVMHLSSRFQSTLPRGERLSYFTILVHGFLISIHAPTRGATAIFAKKFSFLSAKIV